jgi:hypothetical protein
VCQRTVAICFLFFPPALTAIQTGARRRAGFTEVQEKAKAFIFFGRFFAGTLPTPSHHPAQNAR